MSIRFTQQQKIIHTMFASQTMQQSMHILQMPLSDLRKYIDEQVESNPCIEYSERSNDTKHLWEEIIPEKLTLRDHLLRQLYHWDDNLNREIATYIIGNIDEHGYLVESEKNISQLLGVPVKQVSQALKFIQQMDPPGIGAQSLEECLKLQLLKRGHIPSYVYKIIDTDLSQLAERRYQDIADKMQLSLEQVVEAARCISALEPYPGRLYDTSPAVPVTADLIIYKEQGHYHVVSNKNAFPAIVIKDHYRQMLSALPNELDGNQQKETELYLLEKYRSATNLIRQIEKRQSTLIKIAQFIVEKQHSFLEKGTQHLTSLTLKQIADALSYHISTVSRAIKDKYIQTPRGLYTLRYFVSGGFEKNNQSSTISSHSIRLMIQEMIDGENPQKPFSDQEISKNLQQKGIPISRRTVTKYRTGLGIPASYKRTKPSLL